jgi:hypothetical protein
MGGSDDTGGMNSGGSETATTVSLGGVTGNVGFETPLVTSKLGSS